MARSLLDSDVYTCVLGSKAMTTSMLWIVVIWILLAFIGIVIDERMADNGTSGERMALNV